MANGILRHWKVKGIAQKAMSLMPGGAGLNDLLQSSLGGLKDFDGTAAGKVENWSQIVAYLHAAGLASVEGFTLVEIGTGWFPALPFCFYLAGAKRTYTIDLNRHMDEQLTLRMVRSLEVALPEIAARANRPLELVRDRYEAVRGIGSLRDLLLAAGIEYHAPQDAAHLEDILPEDSVDLVFSNSVLEHVPGPVIAAIMHEMHRVLRPGGFAVHAVACNDHYAHYDRSISYINFLRYGSSQWSLWNNSLLYQNRLRAPDFLKLAIDNGFTIVHEARDIRPGTREAYSSMVVAPEFRSYAVDDLLATTIDFVARKLAPVPASVPAGIPAEDGAGAEALSPAQTA